MNSAGSKRITTADKREHDLAELRSIVDAAPDQPSSWVRLARALEESGLIGEALEAWQMARLLVPDSPVITASIERLSDGSSIALHGPAGQASSESPVSDEADTKADTSTESDKEERLDIDSLIRDLQSGRREPSIDPLEDDEGLNEPRTDDLVVSKTLAEIYESQHHLEEAAKIYETLAEREADDEEAEKLFVRAADLRNRISKP